MRIKKGKKVRERRIVRNSMRTPDGTEIVSRHRHDFVEYTDANGRRYSVDGGFAYLRHGWEVDDFEDTSVFSDDDFEKIREAFEWGSYGKTGQEKLHYIKLKDMEDAHIAAILKTQTQLDPETLEVFEKELYYRNVERNDFTVEL